MKIYKRGNKWYADMKCPLGIRRQIAGFKSKRATSEFAEKLLALANLKQAGIHPDAELLKWLETILAEIQERLARYGCNCGA